MVPCQTQVQPAAAEETKRVKNDVSEMNANADIISNFN